MKIKKPLYRDPPLKEIQSLSEEEIASSELGDILACKVDKHNLPQPEELPNYDKRFHPIKEFITDANPEIDWPILQTWIEKKPSNLDDAIEMLNEQPEMSVKSNRLALLARSEYKKFYRKWMENTSILREQAREYWEARKRAGMRKQITEAMIEDWIIENYGDTWNDLKSRLEDMEHTKTLIEKLAEKIDMRDADLRKMMDHLKSKANNPTWAKSQKENKR